MEITQTYQLGRHMNRPNIFHKQNSKEKEETLAGVEIKLLDEAMDNLGKQTWNLEL